MPLIHPDILFICENSSRTGFYSSAGVFMDGIARERECAVV
jgi:hypothetical protein